MSTKWRLISEAWNLNELAHKIGDSLLALSLLKFISIDKIPIENEESDLKRRIMEVKPILEVLIKEIDYAILEGYKTTPLVEALQEEYGYTDLSRIKKEIKNVVEAILRINNGEYNESDFDKIERLLECIANAASTRSYQLISRANPMLKIWASKSF